MATKTLFFKNAVPAGATAHLSLQEGGSVTAGTTATGWVAGTNVIGQSCVQNGGVEIARNDGQWGATLQPNAAPSQTLGDCWRSELPFDGTFANTNWTFSPVIRSVTAAYTGRLKLAVRVWKSRSANGANATELTSGRVASAATSANLSTTVDTALTWTWSPGATVTLRGEYLFVQVGIEVTAAGGGTTQDVDFRVGSSLPASITTPDFVPAPPGAFEEDVNTPTGAVLRKLALGFVFAASSLLTTTLAPVAVAPVGAQSTQQAVEYRLEQPNADTSHGTPKALACTPNLLDFSHNFNAGQWLYDDCTVAPNVTTAPDGNAFTASKIVEGVAPTEQHGPYQNLISNPTPLPGYVYTWSVYAKAAERGFAVIDATTLAGVITSYYVDLSTGAISGVDLGSSSSGTDIGNAAYATPSLNSTGFVISGPRITLGVTRTVSSISVYTPTAAGNVRLAIYDANGPGGQPGALKSESTSVAATTGWTTIPVTPVLLAAGNYWLAFQVTNNACEMRTQGPPINGVWYYAKSYGGFDATFNASPSFQGSEYSLYATFDVFGPPGLAQSVTNAGNGWWRCSLTYRMDSGSNVPYVSVLASPASGTSHYAGDGASGIYIWGAQLQVGGALCDYQARPASDGPVGNQWARTAPEPKRVVVDTTRGTPLVLIAPVAVVAPVGTQSLHQASLTRQPNADTSHGTAKPLIDDAQKPVGSAQSANPPDSIRSVADTTRGFVAPIQAAVAAPLVPVPFVSVTSRPPGFASPLSTRAIAPAATDQVRGPLISQQHVRPPVMDTTRGFVAPIVQAVVAPVGAANAANLQRVSWLPADTSHGTPKPLVADAQLPVGATQTATPPDRVRPVTDTTHGTPKPAISDAQAPAGAQWTASAPEPNRSVVSTAAGIPKGLQVESLPAGSTQTATPPDRIRPVVDTTRGTPKTLVDDAQRPVGAGQTATAPDRVRVATDTTRGFTPEAIAPVGAANVPAGVQRRPWQAIESSQGTPKPILVEPLPPGSEQTYTPPDRIRPVTDTTRSTPKTLLTEALPVGQAQTYTPPDRVRPVVDTSRGTPKPAIADAQEPVGTAQTATPPDRTRPVVDTSHGTAKTLLVEPVPPGQAATYTPPDRVRTVAVDPTRGTPKTLTADAQAPIFDAPVFAPVAKPVANWLPADTTQKQPITLQVIVPPPPFVNAPHFLPIRAWFQPIDGTRGTPKPAIADAQKPTGQAQTFTPADRVRPVTDTTRGTPKPLIADAAAPAGADQTYTAPDRIRPVTDTTRGTPKVLLVEPLPPGAIGWASPEDAVRRIVDTSHGTPKPLVADAQAPFFVASHFAPSIKSVRGWLPLDTSQRQPINLQVVAQPLPNGLNAPHFAPVRAWFAPADSTRGTPKTLVADAQAPVFVAPHFAPSAKPIAGWLPADTTERQSILEQAFPAGLSAPTFGPLRASFQPASTTAGSPKPLLSDAQLPFRIVQHSPPDRRRPVVDTSRGTPGVLLPVELPPGRAVYSTPLRQWFAPADTTRGIPKTAFDDAQAPVFNPPAPVLDAIRPVADTSQSTPAAFIPLALPPGGRAEFFALRFQWSPPDVCLGTPIGLVIDVQPPGVRARACAADALAFYATATDDQPARITIADAQPARIAIYDAQTTLIIIADAQPARIALADNGLDCDPEPCP